MLESIYHMTLKLLLIAFLREKKVRFCHIHATILPTSLHSVTKICKPLVYITPRHDDI